MAIFLSNKKYREKKDDIKEESAGIMEAAANLIKAEIREKAYDNSTYPMSDDIKGEWIPDSFRLFLSTFTKSRLTVGHW